MRSLGVRCSSAILALVLTTTGCGFGDRLDNGLSVVNRTDTDLTIVYLAAAVDGPDGFVVDRSASTDLGTAAAAGTTLMTTPTPLEASCTVAPVVARRPDGSEAGRLGTGACVGDELVTWTVG